MREHRWGARLAAGVVLGLVLGLLAGPAQAGQRTAGGSAVLAEPSEAGKVTRPPKPVVKRVRPASGPATGGTVVKIKGKNFVKVKKVLFGKTKGTRVRVKNSRKVVVVAPAHVAGTVAVRVVTRSGKSRKSRRARFTYVGGTTVPGGAPVVTSLAPTSGPVAGGTTVDISGTGLAGTTAVSFGGTAAAFTVLSDTAVRATSPAHAAGAVPVTVQTPAGTSAPVSYTYESSSSPPPVVVSVLPATGPVSGGTAVTIEGTGFTGATAVSFGGTAATAFSVDSDTTITATTPEHEAGLVAVSVTTPGGTSTVPGLFAYTPLPPLPPVVVLVTPLTGPVTGGTAVTITGTGFMGATAVSFDDMAATFTVDSDTSISATTPAHAAGPVSVSVTTPVGTSTVPGLFTYTLLPPPLPVVALVAPLTGSAAGGTPVTITGTGFTDATDVSFDDAAATFTVDSDTTITATTPAHEAGLVSVSVTTPGGTSTVAGLFSYLPLPPPEPLVVSVLPLTGPVTGGTSVTITGTGFTDATAVSFGGTAATTFSVDSDTTITATTPAHEAGPVSVSVTTPGGTSTVAGLFTYLALPSPPLVVLVTPATGSMTGGTAVTITGTGFTDATAVSFGGTAATTFTVDSDTTITATTPPHALGPVAVSVTTPGGTSSVPGLFVYVL